MRPYLCLAIKKAAEPAISGTTSKILKLTSHDSQKTYSPPGQQPPPPINNPGPPPLPSSSAGTTFSENQLPSVKSGFYTVKQERTMRSKTCRFIKEAGGTLELPWLTSSTAMVIFQSFYEVQLPWPLYY